MKRIVLAATIIASVFVLASCEKDSPSNRTETFNLPYDMIIANEGVWGKTNADISIYFEKNDSVSNKMFEKVNGRSLGDVLQSVKIVDSLGYFIVNNSGKVEVASLKTFKSKSTISNLGSPRYMETYNGKGYISEWNNDEIVVVDLTTNSISKKIKVGKDPEGLLIFGSKLFVANSSGMGGNNNTVSVIDLKTDNVTETITVGDIPRQFTLDNSGNIWVICSGYQDWTTPANSTNASLCKIDGATHAVTKVDLGQIRATQIHTNSAKSKIYYGAGYDVKGIFQMDVKATTASNVPLINEYFYGFSVNPKTGDIFGFTSNPSKVLRYNASGSLLNGNSKYTTAGDFPSGSYFVN